MRRVLAPIVSVLFCCVTPSLADTPTGDAKESGELLSLIEVAPSLFQAAKRMHKFFGDDATAFGDLSERTALLGFEDGARRKMMDNGLFIDFGITQFLQNNLEGGADDSADTRTNGSSDLWMWLDTGKAGWWGGGALFAHAEAKWGTGLQNDVGSLLHWGLGRRHIHWRPLSAGIPMTMLATLTARFYGRKVELN